VFLNRISISLILFSGRAEQVIIAVSKLVFLIDEITAKAPSG